MNSKLTLNVNTNVVETAKEYARKKQVSLSSLVENYLKFASTQQNNSQKIPEPSPLIKRLSGAAKNLSQNIEFKDEITDILLKKHGL